MIRRLLFIVILLSILHSAPGQSFTINDVLALTDMPSKNFDNFLKKKGFVLRERKDESGHSSMSFVEKQGKKADTMVPPVMIDLFKKEDNYCFSLTTTSADDLKDGCARLMKAGFFTGNDSLNPAPRYFQKGDLKVEVISKNEENFQSHTFLLKKKQFPPASEVVYAEDLLQFDSHEYLVAFFGAKNVKKDVYFFSEKELKKCSVLFPNTSRQAVFIWEDDTYLEDLSYVLISGILPTESAVQFSGYISENKWALKNGIHSGMSLRNLLISNENNFRFYGKNSDFSFMVQPENTGTVDFKNIGVMLGCLGCNGISLLEKNIISAEEAVERNIPLYIFYIMIKPEKRK